MGLQNNPSSMTVDVKRKIAEIKAILGSKLNIVMKKRAITSHYLEQVMEIYDISKTKRLMAETINDKNIAENVFLISKSLLKELAQDFQIVDNELKIISDQILECNMPLKLNPLIGWHEIDDPNKDLHINEFTGEKLPRTPKDSASHSHSRRTKNSVKFIARPSIANNSHLVKELSVADTRALIASALISRQTRLMPSNTLNMTSSFMLFPMK